MSRKTLYPLLFFVDQPESPVIEDDYGIISETLNQKNDHADLKFVNSRIYRDRLKLYIR